MHDEWSLGRSCPGVARTGCPSLRLFQALTFARRELVRALARPSRTGPTRRRPPRHQLPLARDGPRSEEACGFELAEPVQVVARLLLGRRGDWCIPFIPSCTAARLTTDSISTAWAGQTLSFLLLSALLASSSKRRKLRCSASCGPGCCCLLRAEPFRARRGPGLRIPGGPRAGRGVVGGTTGSPRSVSLSWSLMSIVSR
jgi:hypothetical protein